MLTSQLLEFFYGSNFGNGREMSNRKLGKRFHYGLNNEHGAILNYSGTTMNCYASYTTVRLFFYVNTELLTIYQKRLINFTALHTANNA